MAGRTFQPGVAKGQSTTRPPLFNGTNYAYWKERMRIFIQSNDYDSWLVIKHGETVPTKIVDGILVPKLETEYTSNDKKKMQLNARAINFLYCAVNPDDYRKISRCKTANEMWNKLEVTYEGTSQVKDSKIDLLTHEYELFMMMENETIDGMFERFSTIISNLDTLGKYYEDHVLELLKQMHFSLPHKTKPEESQICVFGNRPNKRAAVTRTFQEACFEGSSLRDVVRENHFQFFDIGYQVEILPQDSGIRGCWFRALVIKKHNNKVKVQYKDVKDADDEAKNLEEWVLATKLAAPNKLGLRMHGRTILRPSPSSHKGRVSWVFNVGESVDAWWNEGWWEGIVVHKESENRLLVNFPGEKRTEIFSHTDLRHSQEWLMDGWKHLKDRPDLVPLLFGGEPAVKETMKASHDGTLANGNISNSVCTRYEKPKELRVKVVFSKNTNLDAMMERACDDLSKDDRLGQLKWKSNKKRRLCRSPPAANKAHFCSVNLPSSIKVEPEKCKYIIDSLFKSSAVSPLNNLVMSQ
ncbi:unnamed protein product [Cuscuta campestris]|uniref:Agenet domain-containing protein n=1 Tax=Cuscuta campestris TaxID=132261 RepID=A0A484LNH0_9ASTE|nr:unnamed protein product [Cuscuta campestris]